MKSTLLTENDVIAAVERAFHSRGFETVGKCSTSECGVDLHVREGATGPEWVIEAKGETSARVDSPKHGEPFDSGQITVHVSRAIHQAMALRAGHSDKVPAIALPDEPRHRREIAAVGDALNVLGIRAIWVASNGTVEMPSELLSYGELMRDMRWQKKRLEVLQRDGWRCQATNCESGQNATLHVHHRHYLPNRLPWDYPLEDLTSLCERCHEQTHANNNHARAELVEGEYYTWSELPRLLGFEPRGYLSQDVTGEVRCGCFRLDYNPDAPHFVLPGVDPFIAGQGRAFAKQRKFIPVFVKGEDFGWRYCGRFRVCNTVTDPQHIEAHFMRAARCPGPVSMVLELEKER